jgi:hypothetical protein
MSKPPRISANKLAEYMVARSARQRVILHDQKFPSDFKGMYYREAAEAIASCIASNLEDVDVLANQIAILGQSTAAKIGTRRRIEANIDAIETFQAMLDDVALSGASPRLGANSADRLTIQGVEISVRPEIILTSNGKKGTPLVGGLKLHFPKTFSLGQDAAGYVSAMLQEWCRQSLQEEGSPHGPYCLVIDVGAKQAWPGVKSTAARMKDIEAACRNIAALWPSIRQDGE